MRVIAVIPARHGSTRLPAKPLAEINGKPMIQWVYEATKRAKSLSRVVVATDDERIRDVVSRFGGEAVMTSAEIQSGTERVAAVSDLIEGDIFVNVQGDEPLIEPKAIDRAVDLVKSGRFPMATVMTAIEGKDDFENRAVVKVIAERGAEENGARAIYFSRLPIPYGKKVEPDPYPPFNGAYPCYRHVGLYVYTKETLRRLRDLPKCDFEQAEMLEQLRALYNGISIGITRVDFKSIGVDTPEELEKVRQWLSKKNTSL